VTLLQMLNIIERYPIGEMEFSGVEHLHLLIRAMQWAHRDRATSIGDPDFSHLPVERLLSATNTDAAQAAIDQDQPIVVPRWRPVERGTTHVCVRDRSGNVVSLTHSLASASGVVTDGLGFQYNNAMNVFNPLPGHVNSIAPGKARASGMTPTLVLRQGEPVLALGAPGGTRIPSAVLQTIVNVVDFRMTPTEAVSAPRIDCQGKVADVEARVPESVCTALRRRGHTVARSVAAYWPWPLVQLIVVDPVSRSVAGASDPRGEGLALEVA
jgi:gamma-glutamyltranspeptidase/glutathione hydrolase